MAADTVKIARGNEAPAHTPPVRRARFARGRRIGLALALLALAVYLAPLAWLAIIQRQIVFPRSTTNVAPADAGLPWAREVRVETGDGESLVGWFIPPETGKPFLIYLHGNAGTLKGRAPRLRALTDDGAGLLAIEWRGYGGSTGAPSQSGLQRDALAAYDYAIASGADPKDIVPIGESLGTGLAIWLAGQRPVAGLVLDSPYSSIVDVGATRYWMYPVRLVTRDPFPAIDWVRRVHVPIFAVAGDADRVIPISFAREVLDAASEPKTFVVVPGAGHVVLARPDIMKQAKAFIAAVAK